MRIKIRQATPLIMALVASILVVIPRFSPGIPQGVDATSHLSKIFFMFNWYNKLGYVPSWYPDWYGGTPFLLLYSPLSYLLTFMVALPGIGVVSAYKLVDATFFVLAPLTVYLLGRELELDVKESAWGSLLFVLTPTVIGSYLFYDRFPNVVALPFACLFLTAFVRMLRGKSMLHTTVASTVLFALVILIHHLSALLVLVAAILAFFAFTDSIGKVKRHLPLFLAVVVGAVILSGPWLFNFLQVSAQISENPFFNRTMQFPFIKLTYALTDYLTVEQGIVQFVLAMVAIGLWLSSRRHGQIQFVSTVALLLVGMYFFELGLTGGTPPVQFVGQVVVVLALAFLTGLILYTARKIRNRTPAALFLYLWFTVFFWLSLGYYAMPLANFSLFWGIWRSLDVHRFWLYLSVPGALLAGKMMVRAAKSSRRKFSAICVAALMVLIVVGATIKAGYSLTQDINPHLPYTTQNSGIPHELLDYFDSQQDYGRILPIRCPMWIYLIPSYTGKPLIDGWYPQEKLLPYLLENISDYRINDLETTTNRTDVWKELTKLNQVLGIHWVTVGDANRTLVMKLSNSTFQQDIFIEYEKGNLTVLRNTQQNSPFQFSAADYTGVIFQRPAPDRIVIDIKKQLQDEELTIREAYHAGWAATINGQEAVVQPTKEGLIQITVKSAPCTVVIRHSSCLNSLYVFLSAAFLSALIFISAYPAPVTARRRSYGK